MTETIQTIKRRIGQKVRRMSAEDAMDWLARIRAEPISIESPTVRELTGGYCSQAILGYVTWKLGKKAGIIRKR